MSFARLCRLQTKTAMRSLHQLSRASVSVRGLSDPQACYDAVRLRDPNQPEFLQAVDEVIQSCGPLFKQNQDYVYAMPGICEPDRVIQFRVPWIDDNGDTNVNRGFRVQYSLALGPYKGGLRFHPSVNLSIIKFLGFEQIFKNALTGLPMGGGKGGSDFDPKGKSDGEVMRFCQSFMTELSAHIGADTDVPAGDIGVGGREIGFMYGEWKRLTNKFVGVLTGKGAGWGGSLIRPEATGYGVTYITKMAMQDLGTDFKGKRVAISGSGNVAEYTAEKVMELGGTVISYSDSNGSVYEPNGFTGNQIDQMRAIKTNRGRCKDYLEVSKTAKYFEGQRPWKNVEKVDVALPSATQNEIDVSDAEALIKNGCQFIAEGANMPTEPKAVELFQKYCKLYIPAKASNAGGVAVSGLEMAQNSQRLMWTRDQVDNKLYDIMRGIYDSIDSTATDLGHKGDYVMGANVAGYKKVADAMFDSGIPIKSWKQDKKAKKSFS